MSALDFPDWQRPSGASGPILWNLQGVVVPAIGTSMSVGALSGYRRLGVWFRALNERCGLQFNYRARAGLTPQTTTPEIVHRGGESGFYILPVEGVELTGTVRSATGIGQVWVVVIPVDQLSMRPVAQLLPFATIAGAAVGALNSVNIPPWWGEIEAYVAGAAAAVDWWVSSTTLGAVEEQRTLQQLASVQGRFARGAVLPGAKVLNMINNGGAPQNIVYSVTGLDLHGR